MPNKDIERIKKILAGNPPTPALESLYYGPTPAQDVISERQAGPRELLAEKLQAQLERFGAPTASAKRGARKITGYGYPMGVADITPAGIPLWAYEGGQSLAKAAEAAGQGEYGTAALEGTFGALGLLPAAKPAAAVTTAAGKEALRRIDQAMMGGEGKLGAALSAIRPQFAVAYHGTPHRFEKFDISKIGTGEGAQAYGHGLYFAEAPEVAQQYQKNLSAERGFTFSGKSGLTRDDVLREVKEKYGSKYLDNVTTPEGIADRVIDRIRYGDKTELPRGYKEGSERAKLFKDLLGEIEHTDPGALYKVDIPDEAVARMLDWDKPLSEQHPDVQRALSAFSPEMTGKQIYEDVATKNLRARGEGADHNKAAAGFMQQQGIPGIKYLDEGSRAAGEGTRNFVLFSDDLPRILEVNEKPTGAKPWAPGEWGRAPFQYPQAEALETARKNAVTMLGLPENNTAMDRARAMGFSDEVYHGTPQAIEGQMRFGEAEPALFFTSDKVIANQYARTPRQREQYAPNVMPARLRFENPLLVDFEGREKTRGFDDLIRKAKAQGHDAVIARNIVDDPSGMNYQSWPQDVYMALNPSQVRSRFAAFDPARINENDLLGYASPEILPYVAGAGALGGLGLAAIKDDQKGKSDGK